MADGKPRSAALPGAQEAYRGVAFERNESAEGWKRRKAQAEEITGQITPFNSQSRYNWMFNSIHASWIAP